MAKAKATAPVGLKPLFGPRPAAATPTEPPRSTTTPVDPSKMVWIEPRPYCKFSPKLVLWRGHGSAVVKAKLADPRMSDKSYGKAFPTSGDHADADVDNIIRTTLRGKLVTFTKRCTFPTIFRSEAGERFDLTLAAYGATHGERVCFVDNGFAAPETLYAGDSVAALVNQPRGSDVTHMVACFTYDRPQMPKLVLTSPQRAALVGTLYAMCDATEDVEEGRGFTQADTDANEALRKRLEACEVPPKFEATKKKLLMASQADWPTLTVAAIESLA